MPLSFIVVFLLGVLAGCSDAVSGQSSTESPFIVEFRSLSQNHLIPDYNGILVGQIPPSRVDWADWKELSDAFGAFENGLDYMVMGDKAADAGLGWDLSLVSAPKTSHATYGTFGLQAGECIIPLDTPVTPDHAEAWDQYGGCVLALVKEWGTVFSHLDEHGNWVASGHDPNG